MQPSHQPIGIFDSGVGGLSVWKEIRTLLPQESSIYLADSVNCPYGSRSHEEVIRLSETATRFLLAQGSKIIVVACNTATAAAIKHLRATFPVRFVGMEPAVKPAAQGTKSGHIAVLATEGTLKGNHLQTTMKHYAAGLDIMLQIGHGLVELVEEDLLDTQEAETLMRQYLHPMLKREVDQIVLGCSHYPFLRPLIERLVPSHVSVVDPAPAVARRVRSVLREEKLNQPQIAPPSHRFFSTADGSVLKRMVGRITGEIPEVTSLSSLS